MKTAQAIFRAGRRRGFSDARMAEIAGVSEETVRATRVDESDPPREMAWASVWPIYQAVIVKKVLP